MYPKKAVHMAELRLDPFTRRWVVTGNRPVMSDVHDECDVCPFCPGNEHLTPRAIREYRDSAGAWSSRVFHDRAPLFLVEGGADRRAEGMFDRMNTLGAHEVIVETPVHGTTLAQVSEQHLAQVLELFRDRILDLKQDHRLRYVSIFKNQRAPSPTLHGHAFSQVLGSPVLPSLLEIEFRWSRAHYERHERCIFCDALQQEMREEKRLVDQNDDFVAFCPFGSRWCYELWVAPVRHCSSFEGDLTELGRAAALAAFLKGCLQRIEKISPALHFVVHTEPNLMAWKPTKEWWKSVREDFHWHIEIQPDFDGRRNCLGVEGFHFNPIPAEQAALVLRNFEPVGEPHPAF
jgi:UDPglucose--hexose-1-phosphate uridylyltransferase